MHHPLRKLPLALAGLALTASLAAAPASVAQPAPIPTAQDAEGDPPPIQVDGNSYVLNFAEAKPGQEGMNLAQFVKACQQVTDINFTYSPETKNFLETTQITLLGTKVVPKNDFYSFFQIIMFIYNFVCVEVGEGPLAVIKIESLNTGARATIKTDSILVEESDLDQYASQPATLITTVINLPNTDVRQLSNSMRTMITDANTQQMLPAGNSNAIVLTGFGSGVVALARMLRIVDEASIVPSIEPMFEVIKLEYADADEVASLVEELLDASRRAAGRGQPAAQGATTAIPGQQAEAKIMVDPSTNRLLVMAMPDDMPRIRDLIAKLDVNIVERSASYHIYNLDNVKAEDLEEVLNEFLQDAVRIEQGQGQGGQNPRGGASSSGSSEYVVVADEESNSLLIAASRTRYEELLSLIRRLDRRQPQVLIETALIELSGEDFLDIGVELGLADIPVAGETGGFGVTSFGLSSFQDTNADGIPDARVPNNGTGITAGILDGDNFSLPMLIALVETKRNSNVLNVPSVLVNNNGSARVEAKELQPTTTVTATGGVAGQTQENFNGYQEAGITMEISPSISASKYLRLELYLKVSNFLGSFSGVIPPPQVERVLDTTVNVPDGSTMVIGGIVIDNRSDERSQVPWLGDVPVLGRLFGRDTTTRDRTALYFFVTPHIMEDEDFADLYEFSYRKKLEAADTISLERMRQVDPEFGARDGSRDDRIDLEGLELPLYQRPVRGEVSPEAVGVDARELRDATSRTQGEDQ